jgi:hypothetical protein
MMTPWRIDQRRVCWKLQSRKYSHVSRIAHSRLRGYRKPRCYTTLSVSVIVLTQINLNIGGWISKHDLNRFARSQISVLWYRISTYFSLKIHQTPLCISEVHILLERRIGNGTSYTRHGILPVLARYFGVVNTMANDVPVNREHRPSVVSMFDTSWKHGYIVDSVLTPLCVTPPEPWHN